MLCPKCGHIRTHKDDEQTPDGQCPSCGIYYHKFYSQKTHVIPKRQSKTNKTTPLIDQLNTAFSKMKGLLSKKSENAINDKHQPDSTMILLAMTESARYKTNHLLHFFISIFTLSGWLLIWPLISASNTAERNKIYRKYGLSTESNKTAFIILFFYVCIFMAVFSTIIK